MVGAANSGLFNTIAANQSKLNSRKQKEFLWAGSPRRFENNNIKIATEQSSKEEKSRFLKRLRSSQAEETQKEWFKLTVSVLLTTILLSAVF